MTTTTVVRRDRRAGLALIASGAIFFVAEFITAAAWTDPPYSYTYHFISDLGVHGPSTAFGQFMYSPLAWVMNTGLILYGISVLTGVLLLNGLPRGRRAALVATAAVLAVGSTVVALFPGSGEAFEGSAAAFHGLGAFATFGAGNVLAILAGRAHRFLGVPPRLGRFLVAAGVLGFVALVAFMVTLGSGAGVLIGFFERGVIYPFLISFIVLGTAIRAVPADVSPRPRPGDPGR
ncbi:DUF998 domain-containing protein [Actinoplanes sp. NPDC049265]|uniref:DUF998 domain-containing protein n=1 Tax=Actinoplanes sp. NPDC049265 TaxID=3363902 RepID=UPI0037129D98